MARRVESHAPLACFLASGHLCSCLYNSSAWRERMKNTLFFPLTRLLFSIMLHLSRGKYILETFRLGRELNPDVTFSGQAFEVFGYSTKRGSRSSSLGVIDGLSDSRDRARCSGFADVRRLCQRSGGTWGTVFLGVLSASGPVPWRGHCTAGHNHCAAACLTPGHGHTKWAKNGYSFCRKMWEEQPKILSFSVKIMTCKFI